MPDPSKLAGSVEAASSSQVFTGVLQRQIPSEPLGLKADFADDRVLHICQIASEGDTPVVRYNASCSPERRIRPGDYFVGVNGISSKSTDGSRKFADIWQQELP